VSDIQFINRSSKQGAIKWNFGTPNYTLVKGTETSDTVVVKFGEAGSYDVTLRINDENDEYYRTYPILIYDIVPRLSIVDNPMVILGETKVDFRAIYFDLNQDVLISRIVNRRSCPICGEIYNLKFKPTKEEGKCDKCGGDLIRRKDDTEEIAKARFETYFEQTAPLIDYYKERGVLYTLDAEGSIDEVWEKLLEIIND
jgi:adenylate kinase family enzyme